MAPIREVVRFGPIGTFVPNAVKVDDTIYVSGMVSVDDAGRLVGPGDLVAQCACAYGHVRAALERLGASMSDIVDELVFVTDMPAAMRELDALWAVRRDAYGCEPQAAQAMIGAAALAAPGFMIEIKCTARVGD